MRKPSVSILALAATLLSATISLAVQITEFPLSATSGPVSITAGPDGALWFSEFYAARIGRITTAGVVTEFSLDGGSQPGTIVAGPDGALWFTDHAQIGRITTSGSITEFPVGGGGEVLLDLTAGPDGNLWFAYELLVPGPGPLGRIGRMTTSGAVMSFDLPSPARVATSLTAGPDGRISFAGYGLGTFGGNPFGVIGSLSTSGGDARVTSWQAGIPQDLVVAPDGNLWVTLSFSSSITGDPFFQSGAVAKVLTSDGSVSEFRLPSSQGIPNQIAPGPDGNLWFAISGGYPRVGRITVYGPAITEVSLAPDVVATSLVAGPDGSVWMTELVGRGGRIARISSLAAICTPFPATTALCLDNGRFKVEASWTKSDGSTGAAYAVPLGSSSTAGYLWFFSPETPEVTVKVIEGCAFNGDVWFFAGGLTNVRVDVKVTDMTVPNGAASKTYTNPLGTAFVPIQDTAAFPCHASPVPPVPDPL